VHICHISDIVGKKQAEVIRMSQPTPNLIELRHHYESIIAQSEYQVSQAKAQLAHIDALLVNGLLQVQALPPLKTAIAPHQESVPALEPASSTVSISAQIEALTDLTEATPAPEAITPGNRVPRPLLPAYQGLKRLEAIAQVLQSTPGQEVTIDSLIPALFGTLSPAEHKAERLKLKTLLYQGEKLKLWQKGTAPSSYIMGASGTVEKKSSTPAATKSSTAKAAKASTAKAKAPKAKAEAAAPAEGNGLSLLPAYEGMNKLEAVSQILTEQSGHELHQDTIFQLLYGDVSPEVLKVESRRMRASLYQGVSKGLWQRAAKQPSSYIIKASNGRKPKAAAPVTETAPTSEPAKSGRKPSTSSKEKAKSGSDRTAPTKSGSRGRTQVLSLPSQYAGLSKIETVAKVLEDNNGKVMHMEEIIEQLYGKLSGDDLKAEKVRMKDVMTRGVQRKLWNKAQGVPSSIVSGEAKQPSAPKDKKSTAPKVTKLKPATPKKPRKAAPAKATEKPKRKNAEVVALLRKANIKV
jgi:hypothetical protein